VFAKCGRRSGRPDAYHVVVIEYSTFEFIAGVEGGMESAMHSDSTFISKIPFNQHPHI